MWKDPEESDEASTRELVAARARGAGAGRRWACAVLVCAIAAVAVLGLCTAGRWSPPLALHHSAALGGVEQKYTLPAGSAGWSVHPRYDLPGSADVEQMDARDLGAVMQRVERQRYSGFSVRQGKAHLKPRNQQLAKADLKFTGDEGPEAFFLFEPEGSAPVSRLAQAEPQEEVAALRSEVAVLNEKVLQLAARNSQLEARTGGAAEAPCTERCARWSRGGRWRFGPYGHECPDPMTGRAFCHCSREANESWACSEITRTGSRKSRAGRGVRLGPDAGFEADLVGGAFHDGMSTAELESGAPAPRSAVGAERRDASPAIEAAAESVGYSLLDGMSAAAGLESTAPVPRSAPGEEPHTVAPSAAGLAGGRALLARDGAATQASPRQLISAADTIDTFCNASGVMDMHGASGEALDATELNQLESAILDNVAGELEKNNVDKAARDIFSFYMCMRWVPDEMYWQLARQELAASLVKSVVNHKENIKHAISELYQTYKFVPLLCSENYDVFGDKDPEDHTYFRTFKKKMESLKDWMTKHKDDDVVRNLENVDKIFCDGKNMNDPTCNAGVAFDTWLNGVTSSFGQWKWDKKTFADKWEAMYEIFQSFNTDGQHAGLADNIADWRQHFPFHSFVHKTDGMPPSESPQPNQRFLVCFGKRVASELHRRPSGRHILTDQNNIGCHGFWTLNEVIDMVARMVELWKPPTCQLAEMTFVMKKRLLQMYQQMNERLFDALPTLLMDEDLLESGLLKEHVAGPPPFSRDSTMVNGHEFVDGMRVSSKKEIKDPPHCKVRGSISSVFSGGPECHLYVSEGDYGTVAIEGGELRVTWDSFPTRSYAVASSSDIRVIPHFWQPPGTWRRRAGDVVTGVSQIYDGTRALFDGMSRNRYTNLAHLMSNSTSKWVVCPVRNDANYTELDNQLGVEDAALRAHQQEAYAKWTGFVAQLPGEVCVPPDFFSVKPFPGGQVCEISELHADHVEKYTNNDGSLEQFICPAKQNLPAEEQLQVLKKKHGTCFLHMTPNQQRQYQWPYNGDYPARRQFDRKPNEPNIEFELIKLLNVPPNGNVAYARTCGPDQLVGAPRFCRPLELYNPWPSAAGAAQALMESAVGSLGVGVSALSQSIEEYKKTLSQNKNTSDLAADAANLVGEQLWDGLTGAGRLLNNAVGSAVSSVSLGLPGAAQRDARMEDEIFQEADAGLLLHRLSFQRSLGANGQSTNAKERFQRYVVTMPCAHFDPAMEFAVKKLWTSIALQIIQSAKNAGPKTVLEVPIVEFALRGEGRYFQRKNEQGKADQWFVYGAALQAISSLGKPLGLVDCSMSFFRCRPADQCVRSGFSCVPKVRLAPNGWWNIVDQQLAAVVSPGVAGSPSDLTGITVAMYCGLKSSFPDKGHGPAASPSFLQCLKDGALQNARLQAKEPWKLYWPDEVVVVAIFGAITDRECKVAGSKSFKDVLCVNDAKEADDVDLHLSGSEKSSSDGTYEGMHAGAGFPQGTPHEIVLRPEDVLEAYGLLNRS